MHHTPENVWNLGLDKHMNPPIKQKVPSILGYKSMIQKGNQMSKIFDFKPAFRQHYQKSKSWLSS